MSKYDGLWVYLKNTGKPLIMLSFEEIREITGVEIDHSFLKFKKELPEYGYKVEKISMKNEMVIFSRIA